MKDIAFSFPWPPTTNHLFATVGNRRIKTKAYQSFIKACQDATLEQQIPRFTFGANRLSVNLVCHAPTKHAYDLDNRCKAALDALQACGIIENDSQIDTLNMVRGNISPGLGRVFVSLSVDRP